MRALYERHKLWVWGGTWLLTRLLIVAQVGFWNHTTGLSLEDVFIYEGWSNELAHDRLLPTGELWQYPPGAAFVLVISRAGLLVEGLGASFVGTMLLFDLIAFALIVLLARRGGRDAGVWLWLLAMPMLRAIPVLRFDMVAVTAAIGALFVIHRRPAWFGTLAGLGAMVKIWPIVLLIGEWDWRRLLRASVAAAAAIAVVFALAAVVFEGDVFEFTGEQGDRGLQVEAAATTPWHLRQAITGEPPATESRFGATEIVSGPADFTAYLLKWAALAVLVGAGAWWVARTRAIKAGRKELGDADVSRDFVFTLVLLLVVTSRVLSPQYMVWLFGLAAVSLTSMRTRVARPAWLVVGAALLTTAAYGSLGAWGPAPIYGSPLNMVVRNLVLLLAAVDAAVAMTLLLRRGPASAPLAAGPRPQPQAVGETRDFSQHRGAGASHSHP